MVVSVAEEKIRFFLLAMKAKTGEVIEIFQIFFDTHFT
jgi:hypothetical protein